MARITRVTQKIFASSASNNGVFGSAQANAGPGDLTNDLSTLMGLPAWEQGWLDAVIGASKFPPLEEFQALTYVNTTQLAYLLQQGIPEYDAGTTYYTNNIVVKAGTYQLYGSKLNANVGNALTDTANWLYLGDLSYLATARTILTGATNYYVATTGSDTNPGTVGSPFLTIQHAVNVVLNNIDTAGFAVTINVATGTYAAFAVNYPVTGGGTLTVLGNATTPANVIISTNTTSCVQASGFGVVTVQGLKFVNSSGVGLAATGYGFITVGSKVDFGACAQSQIYCQNGDVEIGGAYTISGASTNHIESSLRGMVRYNAAATVTITGTPAFSVAFANATKLSVIEASGLTFSGSATGVRYLGALNSVINTGAGGASYFPGNSAGSVATGAQYA